MLAVPPVSQHGSILYCSRILAVTVFALLVTALCCGIALWYCSLVLCHVVTLGISWFAKAQE